MPKLSIKDKIDNLSLIKLLPWLRRRLALIINLIVIVVLVWLLQFSYQNVYQVSIVPRPINESDIIAKRQKVDVDLVNSVILEINSKQSVDTQKLIETPNPF